MAKYKVVGEAVIVGVDGVGVRAPGVVELDESVTNIGALVQSGCIEAPKAETKSEPKPKGG